MSYPSYTDMCDSKVEWLGDVPKHWNMRPLRWSAICLDGKRIPLNAEARGEMQGEFPYWGANKIVDYVNDWIFDDDLVLLGEDGAPFFDSDKDVAFHVKGKIWVNNHTHIVKPDIQYFLNSYFTYSLNCTDYSNFVDGSTRDKLTQEGMKRIPLPCPPLPEQKTIAAFLDRETGKIDGLIAKKERLIKLLEEKRQAIISHAVTKGLNPNAPMKDSGIEWLGEVPEHWGVKRGKHIYSQLDLPPCENDGVVTAFRDGQVTLRTNRRTDGFTIAVKEVGYQHVRTGDLVIHSMDAFAGAIGVSESSGKCTGEYVVCEPIEKATANAYFAHVLRHMAKHDYIFVICPSVRERAPRFRYVRFSEVLLPVPDPDEQVAILDHIHHQTARLMDLKVKAQEAITKLKEHRTSLISAAVTGKIDVRGLVEIDEPHDASNVVPFPESESGLAANRPRHLVAAEIVQLTQRKKASGRTALHKYLYLAEAHYGLTEVNGTYARWPRGPFDEAMSGDIEAALAENQWFAAHQDGPDGRVAYQSLCNAGGHREEFEQVFKDRKDCVAELVQLMGDFKTSSIEVVATLYAVWNDFLIDGKEPSDADILDGFWNQWNDTKKRYSEDTCTNMLGWMRRHNLTPKGKGPHTQQQMGLGL